MVLVDERYIEKDKFDPLEEYRELISKFLKSGKPSMKVQWTPEELVPSIPKDIADYSWNVSRLYYKAIELNVARLRRAISEKDLVVVRTMSLKPKDNRYKVEEPVLVYLVRITEAEKKIRLKKKEK